MPALFPRWTNPVARGSLLAIVAVAIGLPLALMGWVRTSYATGRNRDVAQPVPFDHRIHARGLQIDCRYCHASVERAATAGLPPTAACVGCHTPAWIESAPFAPVRASLSEHRPIAWQRVNALPDFVFFDHSIHVAKGVGCETCHGRVDEMARVAQATPLSMSWCLDCHRNPAPNLRPRAAVTQMGWIPTPTQAAGDSLGAQLMHQYGVRRLTNCTTCHR
jgi:hypothetical protein